MKKFAFIILLFSLLSHFGGAGGGHVFAQTFPSRYWIQFTDKAGTPYSVDSPAAFLSQRSIDRRIKQSIAIKESDLPINPSYINAVLAIADTLLNKSKWFNAITIYTTDTNKINAIKALPFVAGSQPVGISKGSTDKGVPSFSHLKTNHTTKSTGLDYGLSFNQIDMIGGTCLHDDGYRGEGMEIAVIDAGYRSADTLPIFDSIQLNNRILGTWDFVLGDSAVYKHDSHGTTVLSTMAGYLPGQLIGTAPEAKYYLLRSEEGGSEYPVEEDNWVAAAEYADSAGADMINTSLGYNTFDAPATDYTYADMNGNTARITIAADLAVSKGMIVVTGAGNEGSVPWQHIIAPADGDSVIAVGAVDPNRNHAGFSSIGPSYDDRIKPDIAVQGAPAVVASVFGGATSSNGTSFAAPIAAGMIACLWQANPTKRNTEIIDAVKQSASLYKTPNNLIGYGIPNFCKADALLNGTDPIFFEEDNLISLSPNPFSDHIDGVFYSAKPQTLYFELLDITGRIILKEERKMWSNNYNDFTLSKLELLSQGVYILKIADDNKGYKYKIVKQ